eukprot:scaffold625_cov420-Prasinococcus_capsulatus_cf.AAC.11
MHGLRIQDRRWGGPGTPGAGRRGGRSSCREADPQNSRSAMASWESIPLSAIADGARPALPLGTTARLRRCSAAAAAGGGARRAATCAQQRAQRQCIGDGAGRADVFLRALVSGSRSQRVGLAPLSALLAGEGCTDRGCAEQGTAATTAHRLWTLAPSRASMVQELLPCTSAQNAPCRSITTARDRTHPGSRWSAARFHRQVGVYLRPINLQGASCRRVSQLGLQSLQDGFRRWQAPSWAEAD